MLLATLSVVTSILQFGRTGDYVLLGLVVSGGLLSKYNYGFFLLALISASLVQAETRRNLGDRRILLSVLVVVVLCTPHVIWVVGHSSGLIDHYSHKAKLGGESHWIPKGMIELFVNSLLLSGPALGWFWWSFPNVVRQKDDGCFEAMSDGQTRLRCYECWLGWCLASLFGVHLVFVLATSSGSLHERWLEPFCVIGVVFVACRIVRFGVSPFSYRRFQRVLIVLAVTLTIARGSQVVLGQSLRGFCPMDYEFQSTMTELAPHLQPGDLVFTDHRGIAGNVLLHHPDLAVATTERRWVMPPSATRATSVVVIWRAERSAQIPDSMLADLESHLSWSAENASVAGEVRLRSELDRPVVRLGFARFTRSAEASRTLR